MTPEAHDDRALRAVSALKTAYDGTSLSDETKRRIAGALFAPRSRMPRSAKLSAAFGLAAVIAALVAVWVFYPRPNGGVSNAMKPAHYTAIVQRLTGNADVTSPRSKAAVPAAPRMRLDDESSIATSPRSEVVLRVGPHDVTVAGDSRFDLAVLDSAELRFGIGRGRARFDVERLASDERFIVIAGGLIVEVVGTRFEVFFDGDCPAVSVDEGKVRTTFLDAFSFVSAGASRRFCEPEGSGVTSLASETCSDLPIRTGKTAREAIPSRADNGDEAAETRSPARGSDAVEGVGQTVATSEEEHLYLEALASRVRGDLTLASAQMAEYVERYPDGAFAEEALFSLVRLDYRRRAFAEVQRRGAAYVGRYPARSAKSDEVRILYVESLHRRGADPAIAIEMLEPLVGDIDSVAGPYREQALYLYFASASKMGRASGAERAAETYLERYPSGQYAGAAAALLEGK